MGALLIASGRLPLSLDDTPVATRLGLITAP
ncbi:hypothetical protein J2X71_004303 [Rhizobium sp. 1399]|nr:hypothetical protein [Rhizobium sp. 1399]